MTTDLERERVGRELAERLGYTMTEDGWAFKNWAYAPKDLWDALLDREMECRRVRHALASLMNAVSAELTGSPKNVRKSSWAEEWDEAEDALKAGG